MNKPTTTALSQTEPDIGRRQALKKMALLTAGGFAAGALSASEHAAARGVSDRTSVRLGIEELRGNTNKKAKKKKAKKKATKKKAKKKAKRKATKKKAVKRKATKKKATKKKATHKNATKKKATKRKATKKRRDDAHRNENSRRRDENADEPPRRR